MMIGNEPIAMSQKPLIIEVKVKPNARVSQLSQEESGQWLAQLKSLPVDGKANAELIGLVAKHFGCRKAAVSIKTGTTGRLKLVKIEEPYVPALSNPTTIAAIRQARAGDLQQVKSMADLKSAFGSASPCASTCQDNSCGGAQFGKLLIKGVELHAAVR